MSVPFVGNRKPRVGTRPTPTDAAWAFPDQMGLMQPCDRYGRHRCMRSIGFDGQGMRAGCMRGSEFSIAAVCPNRRSSRRLTAVECSWSAGAVWINRQTILRNGGSVLLRGCRSFALSRMPSAARLSNRLAGIG